MKEFKNLAFIVVGSIFLAFAATTFLNPNSIITGGGIGIAQLLYALFPNLTLGIWIAIVSVPLILIGMTFFGKKYVIRTLICIACISFFTDFLKEVVHIQAATNQTILASIFGGVLVGFGVGFVILGKSSTGGTTILAEVITKKTNFKTSQVLFVIDSIIMFSSIFVYGDIEKALFSVIGVYITSRVIDVLLSGKPAQKSVTIVTEKVEEISSHLQEKLGEHGTILEGFNLQQTKSKKLILVAVDISNLQLLKKIISKEDPEAFLVIQEASELYGREY